MSSAVESHMAVGRRRGFERPFTSEQIMVGTTQFAVTAFFAALVAYGLKSDALPIVVPIFATFAVITTVCWLYCEIVDPSTDGGIACMCMRKTQEKTRYDRLSRQTIPGLDHHCVWLNTAIGKRNYFAFFNLILFGFLQFVSQVTFSVLMLVVWRNDRADDSVAYVILVIIEAAISLGVLASYASMLGFHCYLLYLGMGTYDWLIWRHEQDMKAEQEAAATTPSRPAQELHQDGHLSSASEGSATEGTGHAPNATPALYSPAKHGVRFPWDDTGNKEPSHTPDGSQGGHGSPTLQGKEEDEVGQRDAVGDRHSSHEPTRGIAAGTYTSPTLESGGGRKSRASSKGGKSRRVGPASFASPADADTVHVDTRELQDGTREDPASIGMDAVARGGLDFDAADNGHVGGADSRPSSSATSDSHARYARGRGQGGAGSSRRLHHISSNDRGNHTLHGSQRHLESVLIGLDGNGRHTPVSMDGMDREDRHSHVFQGSRSESPAQTSSRYHSERTWEDDAAGEQHRDSPSSGSVTYEDGREAPGSQGRRGVAGGVPHTDTESERSSADEGMVERRPAPDINTLHRSARNARSSSSSSSHRSRSLSPDDHEPTFV